MPSVPGLTSTQLCGTTSGLTKINRIGSPARTCERADREGQVLPRLDLDLAGAEIVLRHGFSTVLVVMATMSARIGWAAMVFGAGR